MSLALCCMALAYPYPGQYPVSYDHQEGHQQLQYYGGGEEADTANLAQQHEALAGHGYGGHDEVVDYYVCIILS